MELTSKEVAHLCAAAQKEMATVIVGQEPLLQSLWLALLCDGHILLEGVPGLAKTLAVTTLATVLGCAFKRIQFTPDLLPADLIGTTVFNPKEGTFSVTQGPVFTQILLADEINRAPAKVQAALLEVMQERQVTIGGNTFKTAEPYLVLATQNPIDQEGTYPLPEAQVDRFMLKVRLDYPSKEEERLILERMGNIGQMPKAQTMLSAEHILAARQVVNQVYTDPKVVNYLLDLVAASRNPKAYGVPLENLIQYGASPRASIALHRAAKAHALLSGRDRVTPDDVKAVSMRVLRHRLILSYEAEAEGMSPDDAVHLLLKHVAVP